MESGGCEMVKFIIHPYKGFMVMGHSSSTSLHRESEEYAFIGRILVFGIALEKHWQNFVNLQDMK